MVIWVKLCSLNFVRLNYDLIFCLAFCELPCFKHLVRDVLINSASVALTHGVADGKELAKNILHYQQK